MHTPSVQDPEFWRGRAIEARAVAAGMSDELSRTTMLALAARYERLANHVSKGPPVWAQSRASE
jgi:hypothetical protein